MCGREPFRPEGDRCHANLGFADQNRTMTIQKRWTGVTWGSDLLKSLALWVYSFPRIEVLACKLTNRSTECKQIWYAAHTHLIGCKTKQWWSAKTIELTDQWTSSRETQILWSRVLPVGLISALNRISDDNPRFWSPNEFGNWVLFHVGGALCTLQDG